MNFAITGGPSPILRDAALGFSILRPLELQSQVVPSIPIPVQLCEGDAFSAHFFWSFYQPTKLGRVSVKLGSRVL